MKERLRILPLKILAAFALLMGFSSVCMLLGRSFLPDNQMLWYLFPLGAWAWGVCSYLFPGKWRVVWAGLGIALSLAAAWFVIVPIDWAGIAILAPCIALLVMIPLGWGQPAWCEWHIGVWIMSTILHLIAQTLGKTEMFSGIIPPLRLFFAIFALLPKYLITFHQKVTCP